VCIELAHKGWDGFFFIILKVEAVAGCNRAKTDDKNEEKNPNNRMGCGLHAGVAQLVEQLICNQQVAGSSPITSSIF
jgi:hypothetical protein